METEEKEVQTEQVPGKEDRMEEKLDGLKAEALTSVFQYMEQLKTINLSQEQLILRLNAKLDKAEEREEARGRDREYRQRRSRDHGSRDRDSRVVRDRSRGRDRSREKK